VYLVDTNVVSGLAKAPSVGAWVEANSDRLFLSVVTIAEITDGIAKSRRQGATRKADELSAWFETLLHLYRDRILVFDVAAARVAGALSDRARGLGWTPGLADIIIAATAAGRGLVILTRNLRHFGPLGVPAHDPFASLPPDS